MNKKQHGFFCVAALIIVAMILACLAYGWFMCTQKVDDEDVENSEMTVTAEKGNYGISLLSEPIGESKVQGRSSGFTLTAKAEPEADRSIPLAFDWSLSWGSSGSWSNGKTITDYVTISTASDGAATATVNCLKAFGEIIYVTATLRDYDSFTATCRLDYAVKITGLGIVFSPSSSAAGYGALTCSANSNTITTNAPVEVGKGGYFVAGTVYVNFSDGTTLTQSLGDTATISVKCSTAFATALKAKGLTGIAESYVEAKTIGNYTAITNGIQYSANSGMSGKNIYGSLCSSLFSGTTTFNSNLTTFVSAAASVTSGHHFELKVSVPLDSGTYEKIIYVTFNAASLITGVSLDSTGYTF